MKSFRIFYPAYEKDPRLAFYVRSCGHFQLFPPERERYRSCVDFCEIFWCIRGSMIFRNGSKETLLTPGHVFYYPAGSNHDYFPDKDGCEYYMLAIMGPGASNLFKGLDISPGISYAGSCPQELFSEVSLNLKTNPTRKTQMRALSAAFQILTLLTPGQHEEHLRGTLPEHAKSLIDSNFSDKELNVEKIASLLGVHRVSLSRAFIKYYGVSISNYLTRARVRHAIKLLKNTNIPIRDIACQSGFNSHEYFSRVFLKQTDSTPNAFRQHES